MNTVDSVRWAGFFICGLVMFNMEATFVQADDTSKQGGIEERAVPQFPGRPSGTSRVPPPSPQVMSAYRAALNQPVVRSAVDARDSPPTTHHPTDCIRQRVLDHPR